MEERGSGSLRTYVRTYVRIFLFCVRKYARTHATLCFPEARSLPELTARTGMMCVIHSSKKPGVQ